MAINQQLLDYIFQQKKNKTSDDDIKSRLSSIGWQPQDIEKAFEMFADDANRLTAQKAPKHSIYSSTDFTNVFDLGINSGKGTINSKNGTSAIEKWANSNVQPSPAVAKDKTNNEGVGKKNTKTWLFILIIAVILITAGLVVYFVLNQPEAVTQPKNTISIIPTDTPKVVITERLAPAPYLDKNGEFSIVPPADWKIEEGLFGAVVSITSPRADTTLGNSFAPRISVIVEGAGGQNLTEYLKSTSEAVSKTYSNYQQISDKSVKVKGKDTYLLESQYEQGVYKLHDYQLVLVEDDKAFVVTATNVDSSWNNMKKILLDSIMTFELKG